MNREPYSGEAEIAGALVMGELARYRSMLRALPDYGHGRLLTQHAHDRSIAYSATIAMVSVVEDFAVTAIRLRLEDSVGDGTNLMETARDELMRAVERSWQDRTKMLNRWFRPPIASSSSLADVLAFVEVRNAVAHGLGRLTSRQRSNDAGKAVWSRLARVGIVESGGYLIVDEACVARCARSSRSLINEWDQIARRGVLRDAL
jgi:hypothetical protein